LDIIQPEQELKLSEIKGSAQYAGLLPVVRPTTLENDRLADGRPSLRKRASRAFFRFLVAFCTGVAVTLAWWSYGHAARQMVANWLGWLALQAEQVAQSARNMSAPTGPATPPFDQQQLIAMSLNLDAVRQSIDQIATSIAAGQEQTTRNIDQIATSIAAGQEGMTRRIDQIATSIGTSQDQMTRSTDQTAASTDQGPSAKVGGVAVESRDDAASLQPTARLDIKPTEGRLPPTLSETGKQLSAANEHDAPCFPSAAAVLRNHPGGWPAWTLKLPGHEGTLCWYAAARSRASYHRPRTSGHRTGMMPTEKEMIETAESGLSPLPTPYRWAPE
jgi:hypothetical protein